MILGYCLISLAFFVLKMLGNVGLFWGEKFGDILYSFFQDEDLTPLFLLSHRQGLRLHFDFLVQFGYSLSHFPHSKEQPFESV